MYDERNILQYTAETFIIVFASRHSSAS